MDRSNKDVYPVTYRFEDNMIEFFDTGMFDGTVTVSRLYELAREYLGELEHDPSTVWPLPHPSEITDEEIETWQADVSSKMEIFGQLLADFIKYSVVLA